MELEHLENSQGQLLTETTNQSFKDIPGYEGLYQINRIGQVKALQRISKNRNGTIIRKERILVPQYRDGYQYTMLKKGEERKFLSIHRLVAITFIPNPNNLPEVDHIDTNRANNSVDNLRWCTRKENCQHTVEVGHMSNKRVLCIETNQIFNTSTEAAKVNGGAPQNIRTACRNQNKIVYGYHYKYINKENI